MKDKYCTFLLPLNEGRDAIWKRFEGGKVRRAIRRSLKSGIKVERGHHLSAFFATVMSRHMRDLGTPYHSLRFYHNIAEAFPHQSEILMAKYGERYIGGILLISCKDTVHWLYGAALHEYRSMAATSLLLWEALCSACERGFAYFDFGRSRWESGTFVFKRKWGAKPVHLCYEYDLLDSASFPDMDPTNPRFRLAIELWKRLPVFATRALGPFIIRDIP
jgi:FemAB-related protein (PEP-CTERM system-associated)